MNLAVFVPAISRGVFVVRDWYSDYQCQLRKRIGQLLPEHADVWWRLDHDAAAADVAAAVTDHALPWLAQLSDYEALLELWRASGGASIGLGHPAAPLDIADVLLHLGRRSDARELLCEYVKQDHRPGHAEVLRDYLAERDFNELLGRPA